MVRRTRRPGGWSPLVLAGWLLADLAAALVVILLAAASDNPVPQAAPSPSVSSPSPSASPSKAPRGVEQKAKVLDLKVDVGGLLAGRNKAEDSLEDKLAKELKPYLKDGRQAAFVLTFGRSGDPSRGVDIATAANKVLKGAFPDLMENAATDNYWGTGSEGTVEFKIYLFVVG